jgi:DNA-binding PadR family transcriptional regulator
MSALSTHMVLGLVVERPNYGYGLAKDIAERFSAFSFDHSTVYKTLRRLERDKWIEPAGQKRLRDVDGYRRTVYRATPVGIAAFKEWMAAGSERPLVRDELQAKLALATPEDLPQLRQVVEDQLSTCIAELMALPSPSLEKARLTTTPWGVAAGMLADGFAIQLLEGTIDWLTLTGEVIDARILENVNQDR